MLPLATLVRFQLKYCERCGGLWLRLDDVATPYCPGCEHFMAELPLRACQPEIQAAPAACALVALALLWTAAELAQLISECVA